MSELLNTKYNYVFYNVGTDYLEPVFGVLNKYSQIKTYAHAFNSSKFVDRLFFYHWSAKLNNKINLPLKKVWLKKICVKHFDDNKPICYVFYMAKYIIECPYIYNYIKRLNSENKVIVYFGDLISKIGCDISLLKKYSDEIFTYDEAEAKKYDIVYAKNSLGYDSITEASTPLKFKNDVYFVGYAKDRLEEIHKVYNKLSKEGLKCKFIICGTKTEDRLKGDGLIYSVPISYKENLKNVCESKCILDIIQEHSVGITLRVKEAVTYKRKLLSNNQSLKNSFLYNKENMSLYILPDEIDMDFLKSRIDYSKFKNYKDFSAEKIIYFFENYFSGGYNE